MILATIARAACRNLKRLAAFPAENEVYDYNFMHAGNSPLYLYPEWADKDADGLDRENCPPAFRAQTRPCFTPSVTTAFRERVSMAAGTNAMKFFLLLFLVLAAHPSEAASQLPGKEYSDQANDCAQKVQQLLRDPLSNAPDFATIHDATKWLEEHLPAEVRAHFVEAGRGVSKSLADWEQHGIIHGPFWNVQALSELLLAQSSHFDGAAACALRDDLGVTREILQDQIFIAMDLRNKPVGSMKQLGVSDPHYAKMAIMYGAILDFAKVAWKDEQIAQVAKFRLEPPES